MCVRTSDAAERDQALGRKRSECAPSPLELINFAEKSQQAGGDLDRICIHGNSASLKLSPEYTRIEGGTKSSKKGRIEMKRYPLLPFYTQRFSTLIGPY